MLLLGGDRKLLTTPSFLAAHMVDILCLHACMMMASSTLLPAHIRQVSGQEVDFHCCKPFMECLLQHRIVCPNKYIKFRVLNVYQT